MNDQPTRVMLVDDHVVVRQGTLVLLKAAGVNVSVEIAEATGPDVAGLDARLIGGSGIAEDT